METFIKAYTAELIKQIKLHPERYAYSVADVPSFMVRMRTAIAAGDYDNTTQTIKATCKALGCKSTFTGIAHFIANHV